MAYLYLNAEVPYKAAKVMDQGLKAGSIERTSRNYEIPATPTAGAGNRPGHSRHGGGRGPQDTASSTPASAISTSTGTNEKAIPRSTRGCSAVGSRPDTARLVLGMAYFNTKQYEKARQAFQAAGRDERSAKYADQWLQYLDSELDRQRS